MNMLNPSTQFPGSRMKRILGACLLFAVSLACVTPASAQLRVQLPEDEITYPRGDVFIRNLDAIWTAAGEVHRNASILIRDGVIRAIGADLTPPDGVTVIDGTGRTAIPGIVDEHSHTAMTGTNEGSQPIVPEVRVIDALRTDDFGIYRALSGGVTSARIMHGSSNPIGGQSAVIKMRWGMDETRQLLIPGAPRAVKFALGENVTRKASQGGGGPPGQRPPLRYPASRPGVEAIYVQAFTAAVEYRALWSEYRENPSAFRVPPRRDLRLEALVDIMEDRILVHAHSYRNDEILMLMRVAERFGFTIDVFTHVLEGYRVADELREHGAGASTFSDWWQYKLEAYDAIPHNAALMAERGVLTAINSDITWLQTFMNWEIPKPVQYGGASQEEALRMLTLNPATMIGIDDKVGSLEVGKQGDVVLLTGDPFNAFSRVEMTIVDGLVYFDSNREAETRGEPINALPVLASDRHVAADAARVAGAGGAQAVDLSAVEPLNGVDETVAIVGATIHPVSRDPIVDGVLVMVGGRIQAVGPRSAVVIPEGARRIDAAGRHVYPGMIDPVTYLGLFEIGAISQATDRGDTGDYNPHVRALGAYQPHGKAPFVARARGITSVMTAQTGGVIQGMGSVVQLAGDTFERAEIRGEGALMVNFPVPSEPRGAGGGPGGPGGPGAWEVFTDNHGHGRDIIWAGDGLFFETLLHEHDEEELAMAGGEWAGGSLLPELLRRRSAAGVAQSRPDPEPTLDALRLRDLVTFFRRAREYAASPRVAQRADQPFEANVWGGDRVVLEAMLPVMRGEIPVFFRVDSEWQLRHLFLFIAEFPEVEPVIVGGLQAFRMADEIAERGIPVVVTRTRSPTPDRDDSVAASLRNAAILQAAGVLVAFATDESADVRTLPEHASIAVSHGLPEVEGLRAVTLNAAMVLGLDDQMGSLDAGKRADLLITDGNPLQPLTRIERMFIGGIEVDPRDNAHDQGYERFRVRR